VLTYLRLQLTITHMRITLDLPDGLLEEARAALGMKSRTDTVVLALRELVRRRRLEELKSLMGRGASRRGPSAQPPAVLAWSLDEDFERMSRLRFVEMYEP
jgi:Arc/MetJ family transcription regulator